ncbi:MAG: VWA domain-containing protein [Desulfurococcaceae archaeon]
MSESIEVSFRLAKNTVVEERSETIPFILTVRGIKSKAPSACFMFIIDTSYSMDGEKIFRAKLAAIKSVELLRETDYVGVYSFADDFKKVLEPVKLTDRDKVVKAIVSLKLGSGTNFYNMFRQIYNEIRFVRENLGVHLIRLILVTDGQPTTGVKKIDKIMELVDKIADLRVSALIIGVGYDYNEKMLMGIANKLTGIFEHIDNADKLERVIQEYTLVAREVSARDVTVRFRFKHPFRVTIYNRAFKTTDSGVEIHVGDVNFREEVNVIGDIEVPPLTTGVISPGNIQVTYINPSTNETEIITMPEFRIESIPITQLNNLKIDQEALQKIELIRTATEIEKALEESDSRRIVEKLTDLADITLRVGSEELSTRTLNIKEKIEKSGLSPEFSKELAALISRIVSGRVRIEEGVKK